MSTTTLLFIQLAVAGWLVAGCVDWWCHRRTRIEATSGLAECMFHWALLALGGGALLLALWLQPSPLLIGLLLAAWLAHQSLTWLELHYVVQRRDVTPFEQMVHSFLEAIPLGLIVVVGLDMVVHGAPAASPWALRPRPLAAHTPALLLAYGTATLVLVLLPFAEEAWRCYRYRVRQRAPGGGTAATAPQNAAGRPG